MQVVLERFTNAAFLLLACLLCPVQAGEYETSSNSNADTANSGIVRQQTGQDQQSVDATSSELPRPFAERFIKSCTSDREEEKEFFFVTDQSPVEVSF